MPQGGGDNGTETIPSEMAAATSPPPMPPRRFYQRGAVSFQWQAEDANQDQLEFSVFYRPLDQDQYFPLRTAQRDSFYTVEPYALPDGRYRFQVRVSDHLSNPSELALSHRLETEPVEIDLTPPVIRILPPVRTADFLEIRCEVADATSPIRRAEFQVDGGSWSPLYPVDGIADSLSESFLLRLPLRSAPRIVSLRVFDGAGNVLTNLKTLPP